MQLMASSCCLWTLSLPRGLHSCELADRRRLLHCTSTPVHRGSRDVISHVTYLDAAVASSHFTASRLLASAATSPRQTFVGTPHLDILSYQVLVAVTVQENLRSPCRLPYWGLGTVFENTYFTFFSRFPKNMTFYVFKTMYQKVVKSQ